MTIATGDVPAGVNARMNGNLTLPAGGATLNTLSMLNASVTLSFAASTDQLVVTSGRHPRRLRQQYKAIGQSANFGQITAGAGPARTVPLQRRPNTLTINSSIVDNGIAAD